MGQILPDFDDYTTECGSDYLSFIQMLASCIRGYHDIVGVLHYRINGIESSGACSLLTELWECDTSHIDPERQIVENTFAIDECGYLGWKIFSNSDNDWTDYSECGEVPQTLIQLLARCIYDDQTGFRINAVIDTDACQAITALLDCSTNNIESERLLVANIFAVDDCDKMLVKFFANTDEMTDYHTECNDMAQTFYQLLARCIVLYDGHYYINTASVTAYCDDFYDFWTCANNHIDPERALVENVFAVDACGNLALKVFNNAGETRET
jgi:hypothetical protein